MGSWFSKEEPVVITNNLNTVPKEHLPKNNNMNSLNLSLEELLKETAIVVLIVLSWEFIKNKINKKAQKKAEKLAKSSNDINTI
jgi:hypothetical protein